MYNQHKTDAIHEMQTRGKRLYKQHKRRELLQAITTGLLHFAIIFALMAVPVVAYFIATA